MIRATQRVNVRQTLLQARQTRLYVKQVNPGYLAADPELLELAEARQLSQHPLVPDLIAFPKAAPAQPVQLAAD